MIFDTFFYQAADMEDSMFKPVRREAGLGNPSSVYTNNNDPESANFIIKHGLNFNMKKLHKFIDKIKGIIEIQQCNKDCAVFDKEMYRVQPGFIHFTIDEVERHHLESNY